MTYTAKIEQTREYPKRMRYMPGTDTFEEKECDSLSYMRNVPQPSGWIKESGTPPCEHLDVIVMTDEHCKLGDEIPVRLIGVFCRADGDHKLVAVPVSRPENDISELSVKETDDLHRLYPRIGSGEGWFGREQAEKITADFFGRNKRKIIITVQHTESEHHLNGHIGAWGNWELTGRGRQQAFEIGKMLLREDCHRGFKMYCSDLARAIQTAEEINRSLHLTPVFTDVIREVNAGEGNGRPADWYREHKAAQNGYDPDYRPFPDAESDRGLWERLLPFYRQIMENAGERILIVSHGTALSFLHSMIMGFTFDDITGYRFVGSGGSVSKFVKQPDGKVIAYYINHRIF